jgi:hypothetical protein
VNRRRAILLITLTWVCVIVLGVLPWIWPAWRHLIGTRAYEAYQLEAVGFVAGWVTKDVLGRRRRTPSVPDRDPPGLGSSRQR